MEKEESKIQDSELAVLQVLWAAGGTLPLAEIRHALSERCGWEDSTVKTLLRRLMAKGAVALESRGVYRALTAQENYNRHTARHFVEKLFSGNAKELVAALVEEGALSAADLAELSAMFRVEEE